MLKLPLDFWKEEEGQDLVEYALIFLLVALVVVFVFPDFASVLLRAFNNIAAAFPSS